MSLYNYHPAIFQEFLNSPLQYLETFAPLQLHPGPPEPYDAPCLLRMADFAIFDRFLIFFSKNNCFLDVSSIFEEFHQKKQNCQSFTIPAQFRWFLMTLQTKSSQTYNNLFKIDSQVLISHTFLVSNTLGTAQLLGCYSALSFYKRPTYSELTRHLLGSYSGLTRPLLLLIGGSY